ncbi:ATP-grasp domain-containing protein [Falsiroseomonas sp. CW058]|uniref:ATP-grasp domain-containing protein n=1 Tax=Falsiroseomonas sp. CW058 TaxID=3388664 RepID=UPI003D3158C2
MLTLTEDRAKAWLRARGLPVPAGQPASDPEAAARAAEALGGAVAVKALIPTGRRGKAGAVRLVDGPDAARDAARALLGTEVLGHPVAQVYVEARAEIAEELYLAFTLDGLPPRVLASRQGGVEIEEVHRRAPEAVVQAEVDPLRGLQVWEAVDLWDRAGIAGAALLPLAQLTVALWEAFRDADATMMEVNPLALDHAGRPVLVGAMLGVDESALPRHPEWEGLDDGSLISAWRGFNARERAVAEANRRIRGGAIRYTEVEGDIGFVVGGGGAGLLQHDLMLALGGRPANHTDTNPGPGAREKLKTVVHAVLDNPATRGMLFSFNHQQLARCEAKIEPLVEALLERGVDLARFPVVVRLCGPGEAEARAIAARAPGLHYMPPGSSLDRAVARIVELTRQDATEQRP